MRRTIELDVEVFKDILVFGWDLLPRDKQRELREIGMLSRWEIQ